MVRKILFIEPKNNHLHIYSRYELPRLGSILLATIMRGLGYETKVLFMKTREALKHDFNPDLAAISTITSTAQSAFDIGDGLRARGIPVVFGGPHVTFYPEEALQHGDYCIMGEGERAMPALVEALNGTRGFEEVPGLVWRENGAIRRNPVAAPVEDLDSLPFPDFSLLDMGNRTKMGNLFLGHSLIPMQTSRGCPFDCSFCSVTAMFGKRYRFRSAASVIAELSQYDPKRHYIFFYDDNFTANSHRAKELLRQMIALDLGFKWSTQVRADIARDPELLDLMSRAGCTTLYIGFESVDPESLREMKKSQTVEEITKAIADIRRYKIHIHGMFVFGFDTDTLEKTRATVKFAIKHKIDSAQFMILTPLPGSATHAALRDEGRIVDNAWDTYDAHHVKFHPRRLSPWELQWAQIEAHSRFYSPLQVIKRLVRGRITGFIIGVYANLLNKRWQRQERSYLAVLERTRNAIRATVSGRAASTIPTL
jgi:radical SAM superfamily enzyme YgiQ (UPF0313 family)